MPLFREFVFAFAFILLVVRTMAVPATAVLSKREPTCTELSIPVTVTVHNYMFSGLSLQTLSSPDALTNFLAGVVNFVYGLLSFLNSDMTYTITGRYCEPEVFNASRATTLQLLSHPATYDREYWTGGVYPGSDLSVEQYSWVSYASAQGYPTFAFDRLGNGNSSHPDPIYEVQCPAEAETIHQLILMARAGSSPFPRNFKKIVYVGSSMGSIVGNVLNQLYPSDADSTILTGFSKEWVNAIPGFTVTAGLVPVAATDIKKRGIWILDSGYLAASDPAGAEYLLFYGGSPAQQAANTYYDRNFIAKDYANRGTITLGEAASGAIGIAEASAYTGSVYIMTGQQDVVFCGKLGLPSDGPGACVTANYNKLRDTSTFYPAASNFSWIALPNAGHCWEHQYVAQYGFERAHSFLSGNGF